MKIYNYDETGVFVGESIATLSPLEKDVFLIPANATIIPPPQAKEGYLSVFNGTKWEEVLIPVPEPAPEPPQPTLEELKAIKSELLWSRFKTFQHKYVDPEDLTLATALMLQGQPKGTAVAMWVQSVWAEYYQRKGILSLATSKDELDVIDYSTDGIQPPIFTIFELNLEYNELIQLKVVNV